MGLGMWGDQTPTYHVPYNTHSHTHPRTPPLPSPLPSPLSLLAMGMSKAQRITLADTVKLASSEGSSGLEEYHSKQDWWKPADKVSHESRVTSHGAMSHGAMRHAPQLVVQ